MAVLRYLQLDVRPRPGTGNPLGAILDADALSSSQMQALAAWLNLSETVFFLRPSVPGADYHIRIFTPTRELAFAGHPSVGAAWAAVTCELAPRDGALLQQCAAGLLPVRVSGPAGALEIQLASPPARQLPTAAEGHLKHCWHWPPAGTSPNSGTTAHAGGCCRCATPLPCAGWHRTWLPCATGAWPPTPPAWRCSPTRPAAATPAWCAHSARPMPPACRKIRSPAAPTR